MIQANEDTRDSVTIRPAFVIALYQGYGFWGHYFYNGDTVTINSASRTLPDDVLECMDMSPFAGMCGVWHWKQEAK